MSETSRSVFISHASSDRDWADAFAQSLRRLGYEVRLDLGVAGAREAIPHAIEAGLRESDWIVVLVPPGDPRNPNVYFELEKRSPEATAEDLVRGMAA